MPPRTASVARYAAAAAAVAIASLLALGVRHVLRATATTGTDDLTNVAMVYLLAIVFVAARLGLGPAVLASALGVGAFDFLFVPPYYTFAVRDTQYLATFGVILVVGGLTSALTNQVRHQAELARGRERRTAALLDLSRSLAGARDVPAIAQAIVAQVTDAPAAVLLPGEGGRLAVFSAGAYPLDAVERRAAEWAFAHGRSAGASTATTLLEPEVIPTATGLYLPMINGRGTAGVLAVRPTDREQATLFEGFAALAAAALERAALADEARAAWERVEAEFLRNTLLSSVSHDLRTPLAAISGAAEALLQSGALDPADRRDLTETVLDESRRMERLIGNLLDVTRLESGGLHLRREWQPIGEVVGAALHRQRHRLGARPVTVDIPANLPMVRLDAVSFEQVLANLLDNAAEHTPADGAVEIAARVVDGRVVLTVADRGHGVPPGTEEQVFRKFFRAHPTAHGGRHGIGLGLAICRGIVEAHGGRISVSNRDGGGAEFRIAIPLDVGAPDVHPGPLPE